MFKQHSLHNSFDVRALQSLAVYSYSYVQIYQFMSGTVQWTASRTHPVSPVLDNREACILLGKIIHDFVTQIQNSAFCLKDGRQSARIHKL